MNKLFTKIAALALGAAMAFGVGVAVSSKNVSAAHGAGTDSTSYEQITSTDSLEANKSYIITSGTSGTVKSMAVTSNGNNRKTTSATISSNKITRGSSILSLTLGGSSGAWTFYTENYAGTNGYLKNADSGNNNYLQVTSTVRTFTISFSSGAAVITATSGSARNTMRYNSSNDLFACYASGSQAAIYLWKEVASGKTTTTTTISAVSTSLAVGDTTTLSATVSYSGGTITSPTVTYSSGNISIATVSGNTVTAVAAGTVTITGTYAGDSSYNGSSGTVSITVTKSTVTGAGTVYFGSGSKTGTIAVNSTSVSGDDSNGNNWSVDTVMASTSFTQNAEYSQIGASSKPATSITFTQNFSSTFYVTSFQAKFGGFSGTAGSIEATVGSTTIASGSLDATNDVVINETTQTASGTSLVVTITDIAKGVKAYYISYTLSTSATVTYTVTYNGTTKTSGDVPTDSNSYNSGATVTVLGPGNLAKTDYKFNGWNTAADGTGTGYDEDDTFSITSNTTLYAQWIQTLDAITSISGTVTGSISRAGSYDWNFSNISVKGTLSGVSNKDITTYVDLSSTTQIPSSIGVCTVSVTATKKSTISGSASPLTNGNISGDVGAATLTYTFTMTQADLLQTGISYANENGHAKSSTAECSGHEDIEIAWATNQVMKNGTDMQFQTTNGYLYNTTEIPGTITNVQVTATAQSFTVYYGNTEHPTSDTIIGGKYFTVQGNGSTPKASQIVVTFEVSDKPKVQLVASDINADIADGASTPVVTDGTSAVTGYTLTSEDPYVASITNDSKVQPVSYGRVKVSVSKAEDAGHVYLATTFNVIVSDHSKQVSTMEFVEAAGGSATADDGVVWTISANASENEFSDVYGINFGTNGNKVSSLTMTTPADEERIIKNVVVEAMSATDGSNIAVTVGETSFTCNKSNSVGGNVSTYNFSGHLSGAISITISGTASSKYGVKSISILYVGDEATSFASTFLGAFSCDASGTKKPTFNKQSDGVTTWTWALLASEYNELGESDKAKFAVGATGVSAAITECVSRYDYVVGKYFKTSLDTSFTDFMGRDPSPVGSGRIVLDPLGITNDNPTAVIIIVSVIGVTALGGYFFLRKRKEI